MKKHYEEYNSFRAPVDRSSICHAPSVNLNFDQSGNATACCYNRKYILGTYPKNTLREIWEGEGAEELRALLKKGDLTRGCEPCLSQIEAKNYLGVRSRFFDKMLENPKLKASEKPMPRIMEFELSNVCNLECIMCTGFFSSMIRKNRECLEPMANAYDDAFVAQLKPFLPYLGIARFLGGEPFLIPIYYKIWEAILDINPAIDVAITTNATVLNQKGRKIAWALKPTLAVSCDSFDKKIYESIRVGANFNTVWENIQEFLALSRISGKALAITVCPMTKNWMTIPEILHFCNESGACVGFNTVEWPLELSLKSLAPSRLEKIAQALDSECPSSLEHSEHWWVRHNFHVYRGMIGQIRAWSKTHA